MLKRFFKRNLWIIVFPIIIGAFLLVFLIAPLFFSKANVQQDVAQDLLVLDGKSVPVYANKDSAESEANIISVDAGITKISLRGSGQKTVEASIRSFPVALTQDGDDIFVLNTEKVANGSNVVIKVTIGGDGSFFGKTLGNDAATYFCCLKVINSNEAIEASSSESFYEGLPNGIVYIDGTSFQTYGSEDEAQSAVAGKRNQFTLPKKLVSKGLPITVVPNTESTIRVFVRVTMVDDKYEGSGPGLCASKDTDWELTFDLKKYAGHQVTIMIKGEDAWAVNQGFSFISFFLPSV